jgi:hypothetical protein
MTVQQEVGKTYYRPALFPLIFGEKRWVAWSYPIQVVLNNLASLIEGIDGTPANLPKTSADNPTKTPKHFRK